LLAWGSPRSRLPLANTALLTSPPSRSKAPLRRDGVRHQRHHAVGVDRHPVARSELMACLGPDIAESRLTVNLLAAELTHNSTVPASRPSIRCRAHLGQQLLRGVALEFGAGGRPGLFSIRSTVRLPG